LIGCQLEEAIDALLAGAPNMPISEQEAHKVVQRQADAFSAEELHQMLLRYGVRSPANPLNALTAPFPFNLMFKTTIGPEGTAVGYLRPETAQGLFVNFRRLLDYNQQRMPFAAAQIGLGFRNEIAPRNGLLRVREFCMAEIEHFVNPNEKDHPKFFSVRDKQVVLFSSEAQLTTGRTLTTTMGEAVDNGLVNNQTLGYFMARTQLWLEKIGVDPARMRLRQHLKTEMAHYAADCWDMEIRMSYGWIECVGHADRACYDLQQHSDKTGVPMVASGDNLLKNYSFFVLIFYS
jgi:glycyl-tRNA synthetase